MDGERPPAAQPGQGAGEADDAPDPAPGKPADLYGPLAVERHRKDDGRVLILYHRREPQ